MRLFLEEAYPAYKSDANKAAYRSNPNLMAVTSPTTTAVLSSQTVLFTNSKSPPPTNPGVNTAAAQHPHSQFTKRACAAFAYQSQSEQELTLKIGDMIQVSVACCSLFFNYLSHGT